METIKLFLEKNQTKFLIIALCLLFLSVSECSLVLSNAKLKKQSLEQSAQCDSLTTQYFDLRLEIERLKLSPKPNVDSMVNTKILNYMNLKSDLNTVKGSLNKIQKGLEKK